MKRKSGLILTGVLSLLLLFVGEREINSSEQEGSRAGSYLHFLLGSFASIENNPRTALEHFQYASHLDPKSSMLVMKQAEEHLNLGETDAARQLLEKANDHQQANPDFHLLQARVTSQAGNLEGSVKALDRATTLFFQEGNLSKGRETLLTKVALLADNKRYQEAVSSLEKYLKKEGDDEIAFYFLGKIHSIFQNREQAKKAYERAIQLRPTFTAASKALGLQLELEGRLKEAVAVYSKALRSGSNDEELIQKLVNISLILDDYPNALEYLKVSLSLKPDDLSNQMRAALIHYKLKQYNEAQDLFEAMLKNDSVNSDRILYYLGTLQDEQGRHLEALSYFQKVREVSEYYVEARVQIAHIYGEKVKNLDLSIESLETALKVKDDAPEIYLALAAQYDRKEKTQEAIALLEKANQSLKNNEKILFLLGTLLDRNGQFEAGIQKMREVLTLNPNNAHALNHIGYSYAEKKIRLDEAESLLKKAVQIAPGNGFILDSLGWVYYQMGQHQKAIKILERANALNPNEPVILEHLADSYQKMGMQQQALEVYKKIMRTSAENGVAAHDEVEIEAREKQVIRDRVKTKMALLDRDNKN